MIDQSKTKKKKKITQKKKKEKKKNQRLIKVWNILKVRDQNRIQVIFYGL